MQHKSMPDSEGQFTGRGALKLIVIACTKLSYENDQRLAPKPFTEHFYWSHKSHRMTRRTKDLTKDVTKEFTKDLTKDFTNAFTKNSTKEITKDFTKEITKELLMNY